MWVWRSFYMAASAIACLSLGLLLALTLQSFISRTGFVRKRISLLTLHILARGFLMRKQIIQKQASLRLLQVWLALSCACLHRCHPGSELFLVVEGMAVCRLGGL